METITFGRMQHIRDAAARARLLARETLRRRTESQLSILFSATRIWSGRARIRAARRLLPPPGALASLFKE